MITCCKCLCANACLLYKLSSRDCTPCTFKQSASPPPPFICPFSDYSLIASCLSLIFSVLPALISLTLKLKFPKGLIVTSVRLVIPPLLCAHSLPITQMIRLHKILQFDRQALLVRGLWVVSRYSSYKTNEFSGHRPRQTYIIIW